MIVFINKLLFLLFVFFFTFFRAHAVKEKMFTNTTIARACPYDRRLDRLTTKRSGKPIFCPLEKGR